VLIAKRGTFDLVMLEETWVILKNEWNILIFKPPRAPVE
jgi:hypothetical protein